jgi:hypothetical protein
MTILRFGVLLLLLACARNEYVPAPSMLRSDIAGVYETEVSVVSSSCSGIVLEDAPVFVERIESSPNSLKLSYMAATFLVRLGRNNTFSGQSPSLRQGRSYGDGTRISGRFSGAAMTARLTVTDGRRRCGYVVDWIGTKG